VSGVVFRETVRRHVRNGLYVVLLVVIAALALTCGALGGPSGFWMGFVTLAGVILGCQLIGPEFSSGTLQLVLAKPVNRTSYLLSRYAGVVVAVAIYLAVPAVFDVAGRVFVNKTSFAKEMFVAPLNTAIAYLMTAALLVFFGSFTRSYLNVALYFLTQTILYMTGGALSAIETGSFAISPFFKKHPEFHDALRQVMRNVFPSATQEIDWRWMLMVVSNAAVVLLLASLVFRRREVPYGAD